LTERDSKEVISNLKHFERLYRILELTSIDLEAKAQELLEA